MTGNVSSTPADADAVAEAVRAIPAEARRTTG